MDDSGGRFKMIGAVIGAAFLVASGGYGLLQYSDRPAIMAKATESDVLERILARINTIEQGMIENRHRIEALERPGGTTPMARETRERLEAVDRAMGEISRTIVENTRRLDLILMERRSKP